MQSMFLFLVQILNEKQTNVMHRLSVSSLSRGLNTPAPLLGATTP